MKTQHTPGPWYAVGHKVFKDIKETAHMVATCGNWSEETEANARLIAAAPLMLESLIEIRKLLDENEFAACAYLIDKAVDAARGQA